MMNKKDFARLLERDQSCVHCGSLTDTLIPHHRANRGMGGSQLRNTPSNIVLLCAEANNRLESDWRFANYGRKMGWKVSTHLTAADVPVFHAGFGEWWILLDDWSKFVWIEGNDVEGVRGLRFGVAGGQV